jgi:hypothetical protein
VLPERRFDMKRGMYILFAAGLVLGCASTAIAVPSLYDEAPVADAVVVKDTPDDNYGTDTSLGIAGVYGGAPYRRALRFPQPI